MAFVHTSLMQLKENITVFCPPVDMTPPADSYATTTNDPTSPTRYATLNPTRKGCCCIPASNKPRTHGAPSSSRNTALPRLVRSNVRTCCARHSSSSSSPLLVFALWPPNRSAFLICRTKRKGSMMDVPK